MDDDKRVGNMVRVMLEQLGYVSEIAFNGEEALEKYAQAQRAGIPFKAVLMDLINTRGMGGRETMERLRKMDPHARVIVSSGYVHNSINSEYQRYGFKAVLSKPYRFSDLQKALADVVFQNQEPEVQAAVSSIDKAILPEWHRCLPPNRSN